jgi:hypothetical protein
MPHRDAAVAADPKAGLDLLEIGAAVLGMAEPGRDEPLLGFLVGAIQRDRGHVPVQPGDLEAEAGDRLRANRPHDLVELGRDGVQGTPDAVVVERRRLDPQDLLYMGSASSASASCSCSPTTTPGSTAWSRRSGLPTTSPRSRARLATPKVAGQTRCLQMWSGRLTLPRPDETCHNVKDPGNQGALAGLAQ